MAVLIGADGWDGLPQPGDRHLHSISGVSGVTAKPGLEFWKRDRIAGWVMANHHRIPEFVENLGVKETRRMIERSYNEEPDGLLPPYLVGDLVHERVEYRLKGLTPPLLDPAYAAQVQPFLDTVEAWLSEWKPEPVAVEQVVYNPVDCVGGRFDAKVRFPSKPEWGTVLIDAKSSAEQKKVYGDHAIQLAGYKYATHQPTFKPRIVESGNVRTYLVNDAELAACRPTDPVDTCAIVQITPFGHRVVDITVNDQVRGFLRSMVTIHRWNLSADSYVGEEAQP